MVLFPLRIIIHMYATCHVNTYTYTLHITYIHREISHTQKLINTHIKTHPDGHT